MEVNSHQVQLTGALTDTNRLTKDTKKEVMAKNLLRHYLEDSDSDE